MKKKKKGALDKEEVRKEMKKGKRGTVDKIPSEFLTEGEGGF